MTSQSESRVESVTVGDGSFEMPVWLPPAGSGPAILILQEIYGVGPYIRAIASELAERGYVCGAPDMFWRLHPGWRAEHTEQGTAQAIDLVQRFDFDKGIEDAGAAFRHLSGLGEIIGPAGIIGFCFGGSLAFALAARENPAAVVSLYGSGVPDMLEMLGSITAPLQFHFGGSDPFLPRDRVARVEETVRGRPDIEIHVEEEAGHAFHNRFAPMFHVPDAAGRAWDRILAFLDEHLGRR